MRLDIVTPDWPAWSDGGVATLSRVLARGLFERGAGVRVITRGGGPRARALKQERKANECPWTVVGVPGRSWRNKGHRHWLRGLPALVEAARPDALVATTWEPVPALLARDPQADSPPIAVLAHGRDITGQATPARDQQREQVLRAPVLWLVMTHWMREELLQRGVAPHRIHSIPAAIEDPADSGEDTVEGLLDSSSGAPIRMLTVGRLVRRKGHDVTLRALALLADRCPALLYEVVGDGPDRARLERLALELGISERVRFRGYVPTSALDRAYRAADLFVMVPRQEGGDTEGYGLVYLEAGARGLPVIGSRSAGAAEAVKPGVTGLRVDDPTSPSSVASVLDQLVQDSALRFRLGEGGRQRFEQGGRAHHLGSSVLSALQAVS
ncbi:MAG: hypothetical protein CL928_08900 [Deltaproteobacteria bacterium]|nr:hypothetical protein [Deltaproteobacteria bacterium]